MLYRLLVGLAPDDHAEAHADAETQIQTPEAR
jgi:hypothetical protein